MTKSSKDRVAEVIIPGIPTPLLYGIPELSDQEAVCGFEVTVPARSRSARGWITEIHGSEKAEELLSKGVKLKKITAARPAFLPKQLELFRWISTYYGYPLADTIESALPELKDGRRKLKDKAAPENLLAGKIPESLTEEQKKVLQKIYAALEAKRFESFLLFGVTGSGKTEVYIRAVSDVLKRNGGCVIIVPEIALTPQLTDHFQSRLGEEIALLHSAISPAAKQFYWEKLMSGEIRVALGARSAIFSPLKNLQLIIVDEEHESSFKQSDSLRYNARDVAIIRAKQESCPVILGSATPSLESLVNVKRGAYTLLELKERVNKRPVPQIEVINLSKIKRKEMVSPNISPLFYEKLKKVLDEGEQAVILYNRRGFASYLQCETCQEVVLCPNCSVTLTYHRGAEQLLCHYCGTRSPILNLCPKCLDPRTTTIDNADEAEERGKLAHRGSGTERVIQELKELFPDVSLIQMDRDTVVSKESYREVLSSMRSGKTQLLVGTQMIAKGHDLPGVTFVGVVDADVGLSTPDFRANERALQLITQAAGRAGRGDKSGAVFIQTRKPNHPTIVAAASGRFMAFARYELEQRALLNYPPHGRLLRIIISSTDSADAAKAAINLASQLEQIFTGISKSSGKAIKFQLLGPAPAPHEKLRGRFRFHLLVKGNSASALSQVAQTLQQNRSQWRKVKDLRVAVDVDPVEML